MVLTVKKRSGGAGDDADVLLYRKKEVSEKKKFRDYMDDRVLCSLVCLCVSITMHLLAYIWVSLPILEVSRKLELLSMI